MKTKLKRGSLALVLTVAVLLLGPIAVLALGPVSLSRDWRTASQDSSQQAPDPVAHPEAVVQVYAGRAYGWRGAFAVHTWLAAKPKDADRYTRYEVIGWYLRRGTSAVSVTDYRAPDARWFGSAPALLAEVRGTAAEAAIARLPAALASYPYAGTYRAWPGPNSNTFVAHLGRALPELRLSLPATAIGKDYLPLGEFVARTPSGTGFQASLGGLAGFLAGPDDGVEVNLFGLVTGVGLKPPALKLPGVGNVPGV
jgi:hypothetical protein